MLGLSFFIFDEIFSFMKFTLLKKDVSTKARLGELKTIHGKIQTPIFMPVGTAATVKEFINMKLKKIHLRKSYLETLITYTFAPA